MDPDPTYDPTAGNLPDSYPTMEDHLPDPPQTREDLGKEVNDEH